MAAISTAAEYDAVREAIQTLSGTSESVVSFNVDGVQISYATNQLPWLEAREKELARRLSIRNVRKRVTPDFSGTPQSYLNP